MIEPSPLSVLILAILIDIILGEPPAALHPVVMIGRAVDRLRQMVPRRKISGLVISVVVISGAVLAGSALIRLAYVTGALAGVSLMGDILALIVSAYLLKSTFAFRSLISTSGEIGGLIDEDLDSAKRLLPALVSRNPLDLTHAQARSAVIESLSENYVDTIISPLFYYVLFSYLGLGVEAALAFKAVSTMDSMLGYRTEELREIGYVPARLDDILNWIPARLSLPLIMIASPGRSMDILRACMRYRSVTPSPNSGWPMAAAAGALGTRMEKPGVYTILDEGREPEREDIPAAISLIGRAMALAAVLSALLLIPLR
ncbi:cobalamin biosynthesis protein [Methanothrix sp.]|uniref:cobalamin biosynthesis protein n=1 Tax=Methanothrix sp. TaxID=90426 RepID=UPI002CFB9346|nr:cobalamin biosynthesis protein [Methanothrix sp.]HOK57791.1 cobalamin biosynthesis protein [Methanothrix sp.]HOL43215.1 cobalamin biosynthesis protein [Methanothrix sp.]HPO88315.1 cobalamin biosynthesis protein [Methanothrix sp.]